MYIRCWYLKRRTPKYPREHLFSHARAHMWPEEALCHAFTFAVSEERARLQFTRGVVVVIYLSAALLSLSLSFSFPSSSSSFTSFSPSYPENVRVVGINANRARQTSFPRPLKVDRAATGNSNQRERKTSDFQAKQSHRERLFARME